MAELHEPTQGTSIDDLVNDPAFEEAVATLVDRRAGEIRAHYADLLTAAGHTEAAECLRNLDE
jgi:hypothetical protein